MDLEEKEDDLNFNNFKTMESNTSITGNLVIRTMIVREKEESSSIVMQCNKKKMESCSLYKVINNQKLKECGSWTVYVQTTRHATNHYLKT